MIIKYLVVFTCLVASLALPVKAATGVSGLPQWKSQSRAPDHWVGKDKYWHFGVSLVMTCGIFYSCRYIARVDDQISLVLSPTWTFIAGLAKEDYDVKDKKTYCSFKDLVADGLGIIAGMAIILMVK